ncbi:MAG: STAS domain-containing protein [Candidatus Eremiobacteraeota bacterium]|nr:STAS domain-containing protein [Candidatus Eremiobacteraeota bacterium]
MNVLSHDELTIDITTENLGETLVFRLRGSLDIATSPTVRAALVEAASEGNHEIIVDLTKLAFLDSTGLGALIGAHRRALERGGNVRLAVGDGSIARLLNITGLIRVFPVYRTFEDALNDNSRVTVMA